ncbi:glycosyltransferase [Maribacter halichondriae]|uniref:glycosyltransferase n=1 Tax=Maribacter halichondriae TaxID=2980554 RepID=UPI002359D9CA|nr:glycosyltransferase [Maribacter sp. Hal144]
MILAGQMKKTSCDIAIIIINYNSSEYTVKCVQSVLETLIPQAVDFKIIVVDNASEASDYKILEENIKTLVSAQVSLFRSRINTGFGGGNMSGVQQIEASYYLFLNNDTIVKDTTIKTCFDFMEKTPDAAVCGAQIHNEHGQKEVSFDHFTSFSREVFGRKFVEMVYSKPKRRKTTPHR